MYLCGFREDRALKSHVIDEKRFDKMENMFLSFFVLEYSSVFWRSNQWFRQFCPEIPKVKADESSMKLEFFLIQADGVRDAM